jgi:nucleoside phosphorylase
MKELDIVFNIDYKNNADIGFLHIEIPKYIQYIQVHNIEEFERLVKLLQPDVKCYLWVHPSFSSKRFEKGSDSLITTIVQPYLDKLNLKYTIITRSTGKTSKKGYFDVAKMLQIKTDGKTSYNAEELKGIILTSRVNSEVIKLLESLPIVVILTAIQEEYKAVRSHLDNVVDNDKDDIGYESGIFNYYNKPIAKVVIRECGPTNSRAAQETQTAIYNFKPDCIFFVGIAGSRKPQDFAVGDVIFPKKIYSYESGKAEKGKFSARPDFAKSTLSLFEKAKKERSKDDWKTLIKGDWDLKIKADIGIVASGEQLIDHYDSDIGKIITDHYNDTQVVEMEGFGFADVASRQGGSNDKIKFGVVRGISDIIKKNDAPQEDDNRPANVKEMASATASAFTFWLIYKYYVK